MKNYDLIIGIDPDVDKNGVAFFNTSTKALFVDSFAFPKCIDRISETISCNINIGKRTLVVIEAGWKNKSNWHFTSHDSREIIAKKGEGVGRNQETGRKIIECLQYNNEGIEIVEQAPLRKCWMGKDGKITHKELKTLCEMSGIYFNETRSNQEQRDAALLAIFASGFAVKYKTIKSKL